VVKIRLEKSLADEHVGRTVLLRKMAPKGTI
jgi:hypothetical protein